MRIVVYYQNGVPDEFNTETFTTPEPFKEKTTGNNVATEFKLRTDLLATEGLRLDVYWYSTIVDSATRKVFLPEAQREIPVAGRELGRVLYLVSKAELRHVSKIVVDGETVIWRQGGDLINGIAFRQQEALCFSDGGAAGINAKAAEMFEYLKAANPTMPDAEICRMFGFTHSAYQRIIEDEGAQAPRRRDGLPTVPEIPAAPDVEAYIGDNALDAGVTPEQRELDAELARVVKEDASVAEVEDEEPAEDIDGIALLESLGVLGEEEDDELY